MTSVMTYHTDETIPQTSKIFRTILRLLSTLGLQCQCATSSIICHDTYWRFQQATLIKFSGQAATRLIHPSDPWTLAGHPEVMKMELPPRLFSHQCLEEDSTKSA